MKSLSKTELNRRIDRLEKDLREEQAANGKVSKRSVFLMATINRYLKQLGRSEKYNWGE